MLRWAENARSRLAGYRAARLVPGVGPATATRLLDAMGDAADPWAAMQDHRMPAASASDWTTLLDVFRTLRDGTAGWPAEIDVLLGWYEPQMARLYDDAAPRDADLAQLRRIAATYASRERFLTDLTLDPPGATSDESGPPLLDEDYLILSTIHSAKGQEWKAVQVLNVVDGCIPSDMATGSTAEIEEERRLLYVAMTRAKDHLALLVPQRFYVRQQSACRRPPRPRVPVALHSALDCVPFRCDHVAACDRRSDTRRRARGEGRPRGAHAGGVAITRVLERFQESIDVTSELLGS